MSERHAEVLRLLAAGLDQADAIRVFHETRCVSPRMAYRTLAQARTLLRLAEAGGDTRKA